jgi:hypothetical protein
VVLEIPEEVADKVIGEIQSAANKPPPVTQEKSAVHTVRDFSGYLPAPGGGAATKNTSNGADTVDANKAQRNFQTPMRGAGRGGSPAAGKAAENSNTNSVVVANGANQANAKLPTGGTQVQLQNNVANVRKMRRVVVTIEEKPKQDPVP